MKTLLGCFNRFHRGMCRRAEIWWSGLGLVLARRLANLLGGDVSLTDSTVGKGSYFTIEIDHGLLGARLKHSAARITWCKLRAYGNSSCNHCAK